MQALEPAQLRACSHWLSTAGLAKDDKLGVRHNFCCRGPILNPRPDMKTRRKTEGGN